MSEDIVVCVDFDGTIVDHTYPEIGEPVPHALRTLEDWQNVGVKIVLFTMRSGRHLQDAVFYLADNRIQLHGVNINPDQRLWTDSPKAYGQMYVDDAALGCPLIHFKGFNKPCVDWIRIRELSQTRIQLKQKD